MVNDNYSRGISVDYWLVFQFRLATNWEPRARDFPYTYSRPKRLSPRIRYAGQITSAVESIDRGVQDAVYDIFSRGDLSLWYGCCTAEPYI